MIRRLALTTVLVAVLTLLGVMSMHAIDAHPVSGSHHGPATEAANPHHHGSRPRPTSSPSHHDRPGEADQHRSHQGDPGSGSGALAQHVSMCAAVILAGYAAIRFAPAARRFALLGVDFVIQATTSPEPPVPRLALVSI